MATPKRGGPRRRRVRSTLAARHESEAQRRQRKGVEDAVEAERQRFNDVLETLPAYLVLLTPDYHVAFANRFFRERFGESHGRRCFEYLFGRSEPCETCKTYDTLKTMAPLEWEWTGPDGRNYYIYDFPFTDTDGSTLIMEVGLDITERKQAEEQLRRHQERLEQLVAERTADIEARAAQLAAEIAEHKRTQEDLAQAHQRLQWLLDSLPVGIAVAHDPQCKLVMMNPAGAALFGTNVGNNISASAPGCRYRHIRDGRELAAEELPLQRAVAENVEIHDVELDVEMPGGNRRTLRVDAAPVRDLSGAVVGGIATTVDVTEQKRLLEVERGRAEEARLLETIVENTDSHLAYLDRDLKFLRVNSAHCRATGYSQEELIGRSYRDVFHNEERQALLERVRDTGQPVEFREMAREPIARHPERGVTYWDWRAAPVKDEDGAVTGLVISATDVTDRVRASEQVLAAERQRAQLAETLTAEITHRMKNNLAIVAGLLQMQVTEEPTGSRAAAIISDAVARLRAFAVVHEQMYATQDQAVELLRALRGVAEIGREFSTAGEVEVSVAAQPVYYSSKAATNLCVIANELITNAVKHGAPGSSGKLTVRVEASVCDGRLRLSVWNSGNPVPAELEPSAQPTLGLRLVHAIATTQYGGEFNLRPCDDGTLAEVVIDDEALRQEG